MKLAIVYLFHSIWKKMFPLETNAPASCKSKQVHNSKMEKLVMSEIKLGLPFMVPDFEYKFQMMSYWIT